MKRLNYSNCDLVQSNLNEFEPSAALIAFSLGNESRWIELQWLIQADWHPFPSVSIHSFIHRSVPSASRMLFHRNFGWDFLDSRRDKEKSRKVEKWMKRGKRSKRASEAEEEGRMKVVSKRRRRLDASVASVVNPFHQQKNRKESTRIPEIRHRWPTDGGENAGKISQVCCQCCRKTDERIPKESWMNWRGIDRYVRW